MVYINNQKFACESCIKGHRSSSCQHTDRPLFEIKKKGRPVSQCEKCRELRKTKRMHNKCTCGFSLDTSKSDTSTTGEPLTKPIAKARRFKPIAPALPNGIHSVPGTRNLSATTSLDTTMQEPQDVCMCHGTPQCRCKHRDSAIPSRDANKVPRNGLQTLAEAAAYCFSQSAIQTASHGPVIAGAGCGAITAPVYDDDQEARRRKQPRGGCCAGRDPPQPEPLPHKRQKSCSSTGSLDDVSVKGANLPLPPGAKGFELPPIHYLERYAPSHKSNGSSVPQFPAIPPISEIASLAGSGCSCGLHCGCPGCVEHRGEEHASDDFDDCNDGCGTCIDHEGGVELPTPTDVRSASAPAFPPGPGSSSSSKSNANAYTNPIDAFFARAAALPPPPRTRSTGLDATNVTVYPTSLFSGELADREQRGAAWGLVKLPPLKCGCAGGCGCPEGECACGDGCAGCGEDGGDHDEGVVKGKGKAPVRPRIAALVEDGSAMPVTVERT